MISNPSNFGPFAAIVVTNTTGPAPAVNGSTLGFSETVVSNGVGDVTVNLNSRYALDLTNSVPIVCGLGATFLNVQAENVSDTSWRIRCFDAAGAAAEGGFSFCLFRKGIG